MLYMQGVPADQIEEIITAPNDIDQELAYKPVDQTAIPWQAYIGPIPNPSSRCIMPTTSP